MSDWRHLAACRDSEDPNLFFPIGNTGPALLQIEDAKAVCRRCDVIDQCLQWAFESGQDSGVWGGMSEDERRAFKRRIARGATGKARRYSDEQRAEVLAAAGEALAAGASLESAAYTVGKAFGVDKKSVIRWLEAGNGSGAACGAQEASGGPVGRESATGAGEPPLRPGMAAVESCPSVAVAPMGESQSAKESANA